MIAHKHMTKMVALLVTVTVFLCLSAIVFAQTRAEAFDGAGIAMEYESRLFDTEKILSINIRIDEADWEDMLANAMEETYYPCDVEIDGQIFYRVGIRPKGNTSLTSIASDPDTDRYSLKLQFDQYVDGQTCFGLDKLVLNNNYADATSMKEALVYDMYQYLDADASLYNYAKISVNGEYWGVYLALEAVEDSFLLRNYGTENGELYKPDSMKMGKGNKGFAEDFAPSRFKDTHPQEQGDKSDVRAITQEEAVNARGLAEKEPDTKEFSPPKEEGFGRFSMGGNGANLNYIDEDLDSYSTIWEGEVTDTADADHKRVVKALRNISEGTDLEKYMEVDNLLKYMAVHVFSVNEDSLLGNMAHNYYLYESGGQLNILPWDYNLAFGGMGGMGGRNGSASATSMVNDAIDYAFSGTEFFDALMEKEEYHTRYYGYLRQLVEDYIYGGGLEAFYCRTRSQIDSLIESDPTAFYAYGEYEEAANTLYEAVKLRGQSIRGQMDGTIPSTEEAQRTSNALIDASHLDLSVMGSMSSGDRMRDWNNTEKAENAHAEESEWAKGAGSREGSAQPPFVGNEFPAELSDAGKQPPESGMENSPYGSFARSGAGKAVTDNLFLYGGCSIFLLAALIFANGYRRRHSRKRFIVVKRRVLTE